MILQTQSNNSVSKTKTVRTATVTTLIELSDNRHCPRFANVEKKTLDSHQGATHVLCRTVQNIPHTFLARL